VSALLLMVVLSRTRIASVAFLEAVAVPTLLTLSATGLVRVEDSGKVPSGIPTAHLPHLSLLSSLGLIAGAAAVAVIVLVQGTVVAEAAPNPDGSPSDANRDFIAQGIGNLASGLFRGQPVGGSVGRTALNVATLGRSRWASIFSELWMLLILVLFSGVVGEIPGPTLAAVLIFAAASSLRLGRIDTTREQLRHTRRVDLRDAVTVVPASDTILESAQHAYDYAEEWLAVHAPSPVRRSLDDL
jgi:sulfate permease, SulP family